MDEIYELTSKKVEKIFLRTFTYTTCIQEFLLLTPGTSSTGHARKSLKLMAAIKKIRSIEHPTPKILHWVKNINC